MINQLENNREISDQYCNILESSLDEGFDENLESEGLKLVVELTNKIDILEEELKMIKKNRLFGQIQEKFFTS